MPEQYKHGIQKTNFSMMGILLYILPIPLILKLVVLLLQVSISKFIITGLAVFFLYSAAYLNRLSLQRIAKNKERNKFGKITDYRLYSMCFVGIGVLIVSIALIKRGITAGMFMSIISMLGFYLAYGITQTKPVEEKNLDNIPSATREAIKTAYKDLEVIEALGEKITHPEDRKIKDNLNDVIEQSYKIMGILSKTPEDASRARRFLSVYVNRIKEILEQYIKISQHGRQSEFREKLSNVLADANKAFTEKESNLLDDDVFKLDIQLEVLNDQINREG